MDVDIAQIEADAVARAEAADSLTELAQAEAETLGKRSPLAGVKKSLGALDATQRRELGRQLSDASARISEAIAARRAFLGEAERQSALIAERLDLTEIRPGDPRGYPHPVTVVRQRLEDVLIGMGFTVASGPEVETDWHNFEALNMPPEHPARSGFDTMFLNLGEPESVLLRTHCSPVQIRVMQAQEPPIYSIMPGRVFRRDTPDARHLATFNQIEGLVVDRGVTFGDMAGTINEFVGAYFGKEIKSRLRPASFPFTEPSAEFEITCTICGGEGCRTCSGIGWLELGGCGMVHPNVFRAVGLDPEEFTGFAFGFGMDRLVIMRHEIADIREFMNNDMRFLAQF